MTTTIPTPQLWPHTPTCLTCRTPKNAKRQALSQNAVQITAAMALLHAGVDTSVIALWLGHEDPSSTQAYLHADMSIKENALARIQPPTSRPGRYRAPDALLAFLDNL
jgi:integrase/recombinase XerD